MKDLIKGVAKEKLRDYYFKHHTSNKDLTYISWHHFQDLDLPYQWGVIEDWAENEGYYFNSYVFCIEKHYEIAIEDINEKILVAVTRFTRKEARTECIKELVRLINESE
jgi:hypothetical protein